MKRVDLNCDMGEVPEAITDGTQESLMPSLTSVNIACGGHAGDSRTMKATIEQALRWGLALGAHPGYPDRANFGRLEKTCRPKCKRPLQNALPTECYGFVAAVLSRVFRGRTGIFLASTDRDLASAD